MTTPPATWEPAATVAPAAPLHPSLINPPPRLEQHQRMRIRAAAFRAKTIYPGPVGELVSRELLEWEQFGKQLGGHGLIAALVDAVMAADAPTTLHVGAR